MGGMVVQRDAAGVVKHGSDGRGDAPAARADSGGCGRGVRAPTGGGGFRGRFIILSLKRRSSSRRTWW